VEVEGSNHVKILKPPKELVLTCDPEGEDDAPAEVVWFNGTSPLSTETPEDEDAVPRVQAFSNGTLVISPTRETDVGTFKCKAASGTQPLLDYFKVVTLSFYRLDKSTTAIEGEDLVLPCSVEGNPMPQLTWLKDNKTLLAGDRISFRTEEEGPENSTLVISPVLAEDIGQYVCRMDNTDGERPFQTTTSVRVKDLYAALWPFLGIVVEVVVLCTVIFCYERRRSNLDPEESDAESKNGA